MNKSIEGMGRDPVGTRCSASLPLNFFTAPGGRVRRKLPEGFSASLFLR